MGMTIDELVETAQKYNCMIVTKDMWNTAIVFSHKLQKIEQIVANNDNDGMIGRLVREVLEDENGNC